MRPHTASCLTLSATLLVAGASTITPTSAKADPNGVTDNEIVFGMSAALSGSSKNLGRQMRVGVETAFNAQNDAGGIHGRKLKLLVSDDGYEPERAKAVARDLIDQKKVFALVGNVGTPTTVAALPFILERNVVLFGPLTGADLLRNDPPDRFVFNYRASYWEETAAIVRYLVDVRRISPSQIAVFAQDDAYGDAGFEGVAFMMRKYGRDPAQVVRVHYKRNTTDVNDAVRVIKANAAKLKAVVMVPTYEAATRFVQRIRDEKLDLVLSAVSFVGSTELAEKLTFLGPRYATGVIVTQVVPKPSSASSATLKYQKELARYFPSERPDFVSLEGYITANLLIEGLSRAGRSLTTDSLVTALESIKNHDIGLGTPLTFGPSEHQASHKVWLTVLDAQGQYKPVHF